MNAPQAALRLHADRGAARARDPRRDRACSPIARRRRSPTARRACPPRRSAGARSTRCSRASRPTCGRRCRAACASARRASPRGSARCATACSALVFTRAGSEFAAEPGPAGQRIGYRLREGTLELAYWPRSTTPTASSRSSIRWCSGIAGFRARVPDAQRRVARPLAAARRGRPAARGARDADARRRRAHRALVRAAMKKPCERGAALILAMLVAALAATVAVALAGEQQRWLADVANRRDQVQAQSLALAGVQWARQILQDDARGGTLDHLGEPWAYPLPPTPIANGSIEGRIEDAQGRLNLNNAALDGTVGAAERARLARLFAAKGLDREGRRRARRLDRRRFARARQRCRGRVVRAARRRRRSPPTRRWCASPNSPRCAARSRGVGRARRRTLPPCRRGTPLNVNTATADVSRPPFRISPATSSRHSSPSARASRSPRWRTCASACRAA